MKRRNLYGDGGGSSGRFYRGQAQLFSPGIWNRRRQTRRLTGSGWLGLAGLLLVVSVAGWGGRALFRLWDGGGFRPPPAVSAAAAAPPLRQIAVDLRLNPPITRERFSFARTRAAEIDPSASPRLVEWVDGEGRPQIVPDLESPNGAFRVEYSLDERLTEEVLSVLKRGRVKRGHAIVLDPRTGRLLAFVSTDREAFPPEQAYPAASIVKILTAAAMLDEQGKPGASDCVYRGNKYRLNRRRLERQASGHESSLEDAIATSNNQCFSQWALDVLGEEKMIETVDRFGWLNSPGPGHEAGRLEPVETELDLGRLGSGLDGLRVTPLHVASLATILTTGREIEPWWVDRVVDAEGRSIALPERRADRNVISVAHAAKLRSMMVGTTTRGTAKRAFRTKRGRKPLLGDIHVAGKTGNLSGRNPSGRYEWFVGLAPAENPQIAVVVLQLQSNLWWAKSSELAANVLRKVFCDRSGCREGRADRYTGNLHEGFAPVLMSDLGRPIRVSGLE